MTYFKLDEFVRSSTATAKKIDNTPDGEQVWNIESLVYNILDPLREAFGKPIRVNSGFRCVELNKAVGGSKNSDHVTGLAADITATNKADNKKLYELAVKLRLPYKQLINEVKGNVEYSWIHISYDPEAETPRRQEKRIVNK